MVYINNKLLLVIKLEYFFKEGISKPTDTLKNAHQITNHQRNANQNHNEISSHTSQGGYCPKKMSVGKDVKKSEPLCTIGGKTKWSNVMENSMEFPPKMKKKNLQYDSAILLMGTHRKESKLWPKTHLNHNSQNRETNKMSING